MKITKIVFLGILLMACFQSAYAFETEVEHTVIATLRSAQKFDPETAKEQPEIDSLENALRYKMKSARIASVTYSKTNDDDLHLHFRGTGKATIDFIDNEGRLLLGEYLRTAKTPVHIILKDTVYIRNRTNYQSDILIYNHQDDKVYSLKDFLAKIKREKELETGEYLGALAKFRLVGDLVSGKGTYEDKGIKDGFGLFSEGSVLREFGSNAAKKISDILKKQEEPEEVKGVL